VTRNNGYDGVIVGSGPNGLAAAVRLARQGLSTVVFEANDTLGGGARSAELTLPGCIHDVCSAVHPLGAGSPFFRELSLEKFGLNWIHPELPLAHPLDSGDGAALRRSVSETAASLDGDRTCYERLMAPMVGRWDDLSPEILQPVLHWPRSPLVLARFGWHAMGSAMGLARGHFRTDSARALFAGMAAHSFLPLDQIPSAAYGLLLAAMGHAVGWPVPRGGSQQITNALVTLLQSLGGEVLTNRKIETLRQLPKAKVILLDITPRQFLRLAGDDLPPAYRRRLEKFRYGPGVFKLDYALRGPIPWTADVCRRAGTVHVCGGFEEVIAAEGAAARGKIPERPFILVAQPSLFDPTRAPAGMHTAWAYCHVPAACAVDMTASVERQIERFAPGFRDLVAARHVMNCADLERKNANLIGGSISGGASDLWQMLARPTLSPTPYRTPLNGVYLCSSSTPPGGGVHGMCGFHAAEAAIRDHFR